MYKKIVATSEKPLPSPNPEEIKLELLRNVQQIDILLSENAGEKTLFIPGSGNQKPFELPRQVFETKKFLILARLKKDFPKEFPLEKKSA